MGTTIYDNVHVFFMYYDRVTKVQDSDVMKFKHVTIALAERLASDTQFKLQRNYSPRKTITFSNE